MSAAKDIERGLRAIVSHESVRLGGRAMTVEADWDCLQCDAVMFNGELDTPGDPDCDHTDRQEICGACGVPRDQDYGCARCGD